MNLVRKNNNPLPIMTSHAVHEAMVGTTTDLRKVKTALLSVFNKDGLEEFGLFLQAQGVTIGKLKVFVRVTCACQILNFFATISVACSFFSLLHIVQSPRVARPKNFVLPVAPWWMPLNTLVHRKYWAGVSKHSTPKYTVVYWLSVATTGTILI